MHRMPGLLAFAAAAVATWREIVDVREFLRPLIPVAPPALESRVWDMRAAGYPVETIVAFVKRERVRLEAELARLERAAHARA